MSTNLISFEDATKQLDAIDKRLSNAGLKAELESLKIDVEIQKSKHRAILKDMEDQFNVLTNAYERQNDLLEKHIEWIDKVLNVFKS